MAAMMDYSLIWQRSHLCVYERVRARVTEMGRWLKLISFAHQQYELFFSIRHQSKHQIAPLDNNDW